jgi:hypothetical protein
MCWRARYTLSCSVSQLFSKQVAIGYLGKTEIGASIGRWSGATCFASANEAMDRPRGVFIQCPTCWTKKLPK